MIIGLGCTQQVGKDTVAVHLCNRWGFTRLAFADAIRELLERLDPMIGEQRLSALLETSPASAKNLAWDEVKLIPEVRRMLIDLGVGARDVVDRAVWATPVITKAQRFGMQGTDTVITDVRFANEVAAIRGASRDALLVRVVRPGSPAPDPQSERLAGVWWDEELVNDGTVGDLWSKVDRLMERRYRW
jgi:hypothetical protein